VNALRTMRSVVADLGVAALIAAPVVLSRHRLPNPMATHWNYAGRPDGSASPVRFATIAVAVWVFVALIDQAGAARADLAVRRVRIYRLGIWGFAAGVLVATSGVVVRANLDRSGWSGARALAWGGFATVLGVGVAVAALAALVGGIGGDAVVRTPGPDASRSLDLPAGTRAVWVATARNGVLAGVGTVAIAAGLILVILGLTVSPVHVTLAIGLPLVVIGAVLGGFGRVRVVVDERGLAVALGAGWPGTRIPLGKITRAWAEDRVPRDYGGWGYRGASRGKPVIMVRGGACLVVQRTDGRTFAVSVDDASTGAALMNRLVSAGVATGV